MKTQFVGQWRCVAGASVLLFLTGFPAAMAAAPKILWERHLNDDYPQFGDVFTDLEADRAGNVFAIGTEDSSDGFSMSVLVKYDAAGTLKIHASSTMGSGGYTRGVAVAVDHAGNALAVSNNTSVNGKVFPIVLKWSPEGDVLYAPFLNLPTDWSVEAAAVTLDAADNAFIAFNHMHGTTSGVVKKIAANGAPDDPPVWETTLDAPPGVAVRIVAITLDEAGNVIVAGQAILPSPTAVAPGDEQTAYVTASLAADGTQNWLRVHMPPASPENRVTALTTASGSVYVTGVAKSAYDPSLTAALTVKYLADGTEAWATAFDAAQQASDSLGRRSFAGACVAVTDQVWVGCRPFALVRLDVQRGDLSAYSYYGVDSGIEATLDRIITLDQYRGLLVAGAFDDGTSTGSIMVQHYDNSLNNGWSQRISPSGAAASELADFVRGKNDRLFVGASSQLSNPPPATDGAIIALAPPVVPTVNTFAVVPIAIEPVRAGGFSISGRFRIYLSSPAEQDTTVYYHLEGTAKWDNDDGGADYIAPPDMGFVIVRAGRTYADVVIRPLADSLREPIETVRLVLHPASLPTLNDYQIGPRSKATVYLFDRTPARRSPPTLTKPRP
jgi:hypothetical protein